MTKLLKLFILEQFKTRFKTFLLGLIISILVLKIQSSLFYASVTFLIVQIGFFYVNVLTDNTILNNLSWMLSLPVKRLSFIKFVFNYRIFNLIGLYFISGVGLFVLYIMNKQFHLISEENSFKIPSQIEATQSTLSSDTFAIILTFIFIHLFYFFHLGSQNTRVDAQKILYRTNIALGIIFFIIYTYILPSEILIAPMFVSLLLLNLILAYEVFGIFPKVKLAFKMLPPTLVAFIVFSITQNYSNSILAQHKKIAYQEIIKEIKFQGNFSNFLDSKAAITLLKNPKSDPELLKLIELKQLSSVIKNYFIENPKEFMAIISANENHKMIENLILFSDEKTFYAFDIEHALVKLKELNPLQNKLSNNLLLKLEKIKFTREKILNFISSENTLLNFAGIYLSSKNKDYMLQDEILKNLGHFNEETLKLTSNILSEFNCRTISSIELNDFKLKNTQQINSNCKN